MGRGSQLWGSSWKVDRILGEDEQDDEDGEDDVGDEDGEDGENDEDGEDDEDGDDEDDEDDGLNDNNRYGDGPNDAVYGIDSDDFLSQW